MVRTTVAALGIDPPPISVQVRILMRGQRHGGTLIVWSRGNARHELATWLHQFGQIDAAAIVEHGATWRVRVRAFDPPWAHLVTEEGLIAAQLQASGSVTLHLRSEREVFSGLMQNLRGGGAEAVVQSVTPAPSSAEVQRRRLLTARQEAALAAAFKAGYYDVPRRISLRALADRLETSPASLSELLRRAERRLTRDHLEGSQVALTREPDDGE